VQVAALRRADPPSKESYRLRKNQETDKAAKDQERDVEQWINLFKGKISLKVTWRISDMGFRPQIKK
jgi:phage gp36-like protein